MTLPVKDYGNIDKTFQDELEAFEKDCAENYIEDGYGNCWVNWCSKCKKKSLEIVRPGKVQCGICGK